MASGKHSDAMAPGIFGLIVVVGMIVVCAGVLTPGGGGKGGTTRSAAARTGEVGVLGERGGLVIPVAATDGALDRYIELSLANDDVGMSHMRLAGLVWHVTGGTKCRVIKRGFTVSEVRIMEGRYTGQRCFVVVEFVGRE